MLKATSAALFTAALAAQYETDNFVVNVQGASGSISVYPKGGQAKDGITVKQDKIVFTDADGKVDGGGMNVAGQNEWSEFAEADGVLSSTFSTEEKGQSFSIRVDIASSSTEVAGPAKACDECAEETAGVCQNAATKACADQELTDPEDETSLACPTDFDLCTHMYTVRSDSVEFTPSFKNFNFPSAAHGLAYGVEVTAPEGQEGDVAEEAEAEGDSYSLSVGGGSISSASEVLVQDEVGGAARSVAVDGPSVETSNGRTSLTWSFPAEAQGAVITFDPSISISPASWVVPSMIGTLLALL